MPWSATSVLEMSRSLYLVGEWHCIFNLWVGSSIIAEHFYVGSSYHCKVNHQNVLTIQQGTNYNKLPYYFWSCIRVYGLQLMIFQRKERFQICRKDMNCKALNSGLVFFSLTRSKNMPAEPSPLALQVC